jgi:hypothetical protein
MTLPSFGGSATAARASPLLYQMLGILALIFFVVIVLVVGIKQIAKALRIGTPLERAKRRKTTLGDIKTAAESFSLDTTEVALLTDLSHIFRVPNVNYYFSDSRKTYALFKKVYLRYRGQEEKLSALFSLLEKVNRVRLMTSGVRTTSALPEGQTVLILDPQGARWPATLVERDNVTMTLTAPRDENGSPIRLPELAKVTIMVEDINDAAVSAVMRVLRYQNRLNKDELVLVQTKDVQSFIKQDYTYAAVRIKCEYALCKETRIKLADGSVSTSYEPESESRPAVLLNYSAKNCNFLVTDTIADNSCVTMHVNFEAGVEGDFVLVSQGAAKQSGAYLIHGKFLYMNDITRNYMLARVNGFVENAN